MKGFGDLLQALLEDLENDLQEKKGKVIKSEIGYISDQMLAAFLDLDEEKEALKDAIELRVMQLEREIKRRIAREFEGSATDLENKAKRLWDRVYAEMELDSSKSYSVNRKTGILSEKIRTNL